MDILMCAPDYYGIEYEINPWMDVRKKSDPKLARKQWEGLYALLTQALGVKGHLIAPIKGLPDMVFTANAGLVSGRTFILGNLRHPERRGESAYYRAWFEAKGYVVQTVPPDYFFEGEGDALLFGENLFAGYRTRSDIRAHDLIGKVLEKRVLSLELVDERFYHLDTCFCPLDDQRALYYPEAFDAYGRKVINQFVPKPIPVSQEDALRFGCNAVVLGNHVICQEGCVDLKARLSDEKFIVNEVDLSEFMKAGGSAKCLTLRIG